MSAKPESTPTQRRRAPLVLATIVCALMGCTNAASPMPPSVTTTSAPATVGATVLDDTTASGASTEPAGAQPQLSPDPVQLADDLVADEQALRDPSIPEAALAAAARRQQAAYRAIGRHREWDTITRARIPPSLLETYDRNVDARRQLAALAQVKDTVPPWRIVPPAPADELLGCYRDAEQASEGAAPTTTWRSMRGGDSE